MIALAVLGWCCAVVFFAFWVIEHIGGADQRDELRERAHRDLAPVVPIGGRG